MLLDLLGFESNVNLTTYTPPRNIQYNIVGWILALIQLSIISVTNLHLVVLDITIDQNGMTNNEF
jgi:hypothetical protein